MQGGQRVQENCMLAVAAPLPTASGVDRKHSSGRPQRQCWVHSPVYTVLGYCNPLELSGGVKPPHSDLRITHPLHHSSLVTPCEQGLPEGLSGRLGFLIYLDPEACASLCSTPPLLPNPERKNVEMESICCMPCSSSGAPYRTLCPQAAEDWPP